MGACTTRTRILPVDVSGITIPYTGNLHALVSTFLVWLWACLDTYYAPSLICLVTLNHIHKVSSVEFWPLNALISCSRSGIACLHISPVVPAIKNRGYFVDVGSRDRPHRFVYVPYENERQVSSIELNYGMDYRIRGAFLEFLHWRSALGYNRVPMHPLERFRVIPSVQQSSQPSESRK